MKKILILVALYINCNAIFSQNTFETLISEPDDQVINTITEDDDGNFVAIGRIYLNENNTASGYMLELNQQGKLINEQNIQIADTISNILFNVHYINNSFYFIGSGINSSENGFLWFLKLNKGLEKIEDKVLTIPIGRWFSYINSILDSDSNFVLTGYTTRHDTLPNAPYNNDPFFYKVSKKGDSISSKFITSIIYLSYSYDIIEKLDSSGYYAYGHRFSDSIGYSGQRLELRKDFDNVYIDSIPRLIRDYYSPKRLNDSLILICGSGGFPDYTPPYSLNVLSTTEENIEMSYNHFKIEGNERDHPAMYNGVSIFGNNNYIGGTSNFDYANPFWSSLDSYYHLVKVDEEINPIWEYWYGGDAYYFLYSILATNDGGCIMVGNRYDDADQYMERDIYFVKVNSEGLVVGTEETPAGETHEAIVFPNPGTDRMQVRVAVQHPQSTVELYDIRGALVARQNIAGHWGEVNTTFLPQETYVYRITSPTGIFECGKWVKQ